MKLREIEDLLQRFIDGDLDDHACEEMITLLKADPAVFESYCSYAGLDAGLRYLTTGPAHPGAVRSVIDESARERRLAKARMISLLTAAAAVLLLSAVLYVFLAPERRPALTYQSSPGTRFSIAHAADGKAAPPPGTLAVGSRLSLEHGFVELAFANGVRSIVQAPAVLSIEDKQRLSLDEGRAWFHVPAGAEGFEVRTLELAIVDLGTEFAVESRAKHPDEVHVFSGKVEARVIGSDATPEILTTGSARAVTMAGELATIAPQRDSFSRHLPDHALSRLHWSFDEGDPGAQTVRGEHPALARMESRCFSSSGTDSFASFSVSTGKFGNALSSLGRGGHVATNWSGPAAGKPWTVAYWIKMPAGQTSRQSVLGWGGGSDAFLSSVRHIATGCVTEVVLGGTEYHGRTRLDDGRWHHLVITSDQRRGADGIPAFTVLINGHEETMHRAPGDSGPVGFPGRLLEDESKPTDQPSPLTLFARTWDLEQLGGDIALALVRQDGVTRVYLNGVKIGENTGFPPGLDVPTTLIIGANRDSGGQLEGFFSGAIDRVRLSTFSGSLDSGGLLGSSPPEFTVVADYTFDDPRTPSGFTEIGTPTYSDGYLLLNGADALELTPTPLTASDNFVIEAKLRMTEFPTNPLKFAFPVSNSNGANRGWGLLYQHTWGGIIMNHAPVGSASATHGQEVGLSIDELHVFEAILDARRIAALVQSNDPNPPPRQAKADKHPSESMNPNE